ncbi:PAQR family membrane homeostasis protein TrhA [Flavobacterium lacus]|uniref:Hemolysin III n=1 Tax=Flavobacterium lacus TaxID=1353778 RepID=A0A328WQX9_9FLAO|nr:hemolysin III family protein [Flavobacterium lacus]RAR48553.1 hemolysin III [Flavobacterium lacus]
MSKRVQTQKEEIINAITHGFGILFCLIAMPFLLVDSFNENQLSTFISVLAFGVGMLLVYTFSTLFHAVKNPKVKDILQIGDHISIYFLIAGTYTPLMVRYLPSRTATLFLGVMWSIVAVGIIFKIFFTKKFRFISVLLYLALGWMIVFVIEPLIHTMPFSVFMWILIGGLSYTIGVYFYMKDHKFYYHTIWHFFVLFGTIAHFVSIYLSV